ncbi:GNAT family N-acetyltransferase [Rhodopirellula sp. MGV]|uniref:GNAT family N-acetyltransferase n=1 Tax=Rhodopirellula sp. MGV TaxID=2023130 RepID=UPI00130460BB|nr:GNAT family N-acetyltransferase [Rhodopirellula sp. MGV]
MRYNELLALVPRWETLIDRCPWRNPCYEPEFLLSLLRAIDIGSVRVMVAERGNELVGLMPIATKQQFHLPIRIAETWRPDEAFDATPLLDSFWAGDALQACFKSLRRHGFHLLSLNTVSANPEFVSVFQTATTATSLAYFTRDQFQRAALRPAGGAEEYFQRVLSKNRRKKFSRALKSLESRGTVRFETAAVPAQARDWMEVFLDLEASGWKGNASTAFASEDDSLSFFLDMIGRLIDSEKLHITRLTVNRNPIAMLIDIRSADHVACYKTAFDERYSQYSPGALLEWHNVRRMFDQGVSLCDSCGDPDNELLNALYNERLDFQHLIVSLDRWTNFIPKRVLPALQWIKRRLPSQRGNESTPKG